MIVLAHDFYYNLFKWKNFVNKNISIALQSTVYINTENKIGKGPSCDRALHRVISFLVISLLIIHIGATKWSQRDKIFATSLYTISVLLYKRRLKWDKNSIQCRIRWQLLSECHSLYHTLLLCLSILSLYFMWDEFLFYFCWFLCVHILTKFYV